jgi:hypothetical protein
MIVPFNSLTRSLDFDFDTAMTAGRINARLVEAGMPYFYWHRDPCSSRILSKRPTYAMPHNDGRCTGLYLNMRGIVKGVPSAGFRTNWFSIIPFWERD